MWGFRLAVDYGTATTVAYLRWPDGAIRPLHFDASPILPSAVFADRNGVLLAGRPAEVAGQAEPNCYEQYPKRHIDELTVTLRDRAYETVDLVAAVLNRVAAEAHRLLGTPVTDVVLTAPAQWGQARRAVLVAAAMRAGLGAVRLMPEAVAAAQYFTSVGHIVPPGASVVVYDLGAGTFEVSVLRNSPGWETLAHQGLPDVGGLWIAEAVRSGTDEPDAVVASYIARTLEVTQAAMRAARVPTEHYAAVFLVGGATRTPLVATMVRETLGITPVSATHPEFVIAHGALTGGAPPPPAMVAPPVGGPPLAGSSVHLIELVLAKNVGYTLRAVRRDEFGELDVRFLIEGGRLQLFADPAAAIRYALQVSSHDLAALPDWATVIGWLAATPAAVADENRFALELVAFQLEAAPQYWVASRLIACRDVAAQLCIALRLETEEYVEDGSELDRLDDILRKDPGLGMVSRLRLRQIGVEVVAAQWRAIVEDIDDVVAMHE